MKNCGDGLILDLETLFMDFDFDFDFSRTLRVK